MKRENAASAATDTHAHKVLIDAPVIDEILLLLDHAKGDLKAGRGAKVLGLLDRAWATLMDVKARDMAEIGGFTRRRGRCEPRPVSEKAMSDAAALRARSRACRSAGNGAIADIFAFRAALLDGDWAEISEAAERVAGPSFTARANTIDYVRLADDPEVEASARLADRDARRGGTDIRYTMADGSMFEGKPEDIATLMRNLGRDGSDAS